MDIIIGHQNHDFDCVASMVAAKRLYPEGRIFLQPTAEGGVLEFLNLYRDYFSFFRFSQYRDEKIKKLIIVDTNKKERLGPYEKTLARAEEIIVYDHHPPGEATIDADEYYYDEAGALITVMVNKLRKKNIIPTPFEATLFMLGVHQETGNLQFGTTAAADYEVGCFLMENGADLDIVQNFCNRKLNAEQRELFNDILSGSHQFSINNIPVTIASASRDEYVPELALLAHKLRDVENINLLFLLVKMGNRIQLVIRNRYQHVDAGAIAGQFGGGGHKRAASATLSGVTLSEAQEAIIDLLKNKLKPEITAADIMSSPVHSVRQDLPVEEAHKIMLRLGHHGLPITDSDDRLVGIITRSDVDKAIHHSLTHAPVKGFMSPEVTTVSPETGLQQIQNILMENQIGRLPVVAGERLVGIVTRTDIIRVLHERYQPSREEQFRSSPAYSSIREPDNVEYLLKEILSEKWYRRLREWGKLSGRIGDSVFLVGGCVRDILMEEETRDFDFVVEKDGIGFARALVEKEGGSLSVHEKFKTAVVTLEDGCKLDIATARSEYYSHPAALPRVDIDHASVYQDLQRRDFTINAMAINLLPDHFGDLLDFYGGRRDIEEGRIRVLHTTSFLDDPTRIFRAVRFAARFNFKIARSTEFQLNQALPGSPFQSVSGDRLREELNQLFLEADPWFGVKKLFEYNVLQVLEPELELLEEMKEWFGRARELIKRYNPALPQMLYYCLLFEPLKLEKAVSLARRLTFRQDSMEILEKYKEFDNFRDELLWASKDSRIYELADRISLTESILALMAREPEKNREKLRRYLEELQKIEPVIDGKQLIKLGMKPGPELGYALEKMFMYQLDMENPTPEKLLDRLKTEEPQLAGGL
ncbi:MAG: CBS domain-containing protein [bacterium]